ncbi:MAG: anti-sigma factor [Candidatus Eisenbacteria bacterium]|uniref:Regulator of SigK n=1 Tax=Eiseniibacteriota bacterium TaxID=2212470 RepID=A0A956M3U1_UNCEI|nr:anti-sigma factor [Candidatus Eisenbacteria bacterium]
MNRSHEPFLELCAGYVLEILEPDERQLLQAHLDEGCPECEALLRELAEGGALLASTAPAIPPPAAIKERMLAQVRSEQHAADPRPAPAIRAEQPAVIYRMPVWARIGMTALAAASLLLAFDAFRIRQRNAQLDQQLFFVRAQLTQMESQLQEEAKWAQVVSSTEARFALLSATPDGHPEQAAWAMFDPESQRAVVLVNEAAAPAGKDYELWAIADGAPRSLGLIHPDASGRALLHLEDLGKVDAFAVSLEPTGGSPDPRAPSGPVVLVGNVQG